MSKTIVAYFSVTGTTRKAAGEIADATGADLLEIVPKVKYGSADLNWLDKNARSTLEMRDKSCRPEMEPLDADLSGYEKVFLGFPIWWYVAPMIINTFLEAYDFTGKDVILFATSGGSGFGNTAEELRASAPGAKIIEGRLLNRMSAQEIKEWAESV